jgi:hypothetical protein
MIHNDDDLRQFEANGALQLPRADVEGRVEYEGARIWYAAYGAGEPVVLLRMRLRLRSSRWSAGATARRSDSCSP